MTSKLTNRQQKVLNALKSDPERKWSFAEVGDLVGTNQSGAVSIIRFLAKRGHGEFRDQVMGEKYLPMTPERLEAKQKRLEYRRREVELGCRISFGG